MKDYYAILGLGQQAGEMEIKKAYRRLAKQYHPDVNAGGDAQQRFIEVNEAYAFLSDSKRRNGYRHQSVTDAERLRREELYRQWTQQQQQHARSEARRYAAQPMGDFVKSPIYKTAMVISKMYNYVFLAIGFVMAFGPALHYLFLTAEERVEQQMSASAIVLPMIFGSLFTYGIYVFLFKYNLDNDA